MYCGVQPDLKIVNGRCYHTKNREVYEGVYEFVNA